MVTGAENNPLLLGAPASTTLIEDKAESRGTQVSTLNKIEDHVECVLRRCSLQAVKMKV